MCTHLAAMESEVLKIQQQNRARKHDGFASLLSTSNAADVGSLGNHSLLKNEHL
jgi:hypothetical protein